MNTTSNKIGENIQRALDKRNKTQAWLGKEIGLSEGSARQHVNKWIHGRIMPRIENIGKIADALGYSVNEIVTGNFRDDMTKVSEPLTSYQPIIDSELKAIDQIMDKLAEEEMGLKTRNTYKAQVKSKIKFLLDAVC